MREDGRLLNFLAEVEEVQALAALNEYHSAVNETSVQIRNKPAYLMGILRKYKQGQRAPTASGTGTGLPIEHGRNTMGRMGTGPGGLVPSIRNRLEKLFKSQFVQRSDVDQRCLDFFQDLTKAEADAAMDEFSQSDIASIRNKSAFLMSILRKHHQQGVPMGGGGGGYGGRTLGYERGYGGVERGGSGYRDVPVVGPYGAGPDPPMREQVGMGLGVGTPYTNSHRPDPYTNGRPSHNLPYAGRGGPVVPLPMDGPEPLPPNIEYRLEHLFETGFCHPEEIDDRCRKFLCEVPESVAIQAIDEFSTVDRGYIRKVSAYFMGVIRKHADLDRG
ncbi:unnamed protein product, partial [Choristocarpus tenellus]